MNEALRKLYIDFIQEYDPYNQDETPEDLDEMLYNLEEIRNDFDPCETDEELVYMLEYLNNIIGQFRAAGIRRIDA